MIGFIFDIFCKYNVSRALTSRTALTFLNFLVIVIAGGSQPAFNVYLEYGTFR